MHALLRQATILSLALSLPLRSHPYNNCASPLTRPCHAADRAVGGARGGGGGHPAHPRQQLQDEGPPHGPRRPLLRGPRTVGRGPQTGEPQRRGGLHQGVPEAAARAPAHQRLHSGLPQHAQ